MKREHRRLPARYRSFALEQEAFAEHASWLLFLGKGGDWLAAGKFKVHLADPHGLFTDRPWCGNPPPQVNGKDAPHGSVAPTHPSQVCAACRAIGIEKKLVWRQVLYVQETPHA